MKSPFDTPRNHRLLAAVSVLVQLYGKNGLMGVTAKKRYKAVNERLANQRKQPVSKDTIRRAVKLLATQIPSGGEK
jgi:hypothetical protein